MAQHLVGIPRGRGRLPAPLNRRSACLVSLVILCIPCLALGNETTTVNKVAGDFIADQTTSTHRMAGGFQPTGSDAMQLQTTSGDVVHIASTDAEGVKTFVNSQQHPLAIAANDLYKYGMTILFIFGAIGNFLAIAVLLRKRMRNSSGTLYLIVIGFIDQYNIFAAVLGSHVIRSYTDFDYIRSDSGLCKFAYFTIVACAQTAFYLMAAMTMERAIVVSNPLKHMNTFTRKRTVYIIIGIILVWIVKNLEKFWSLGAVYKEDVNGTLVLDRECGITAGATFDFSINIRPWLDYVITFLAALIIIICNIVIVVCVSRSGRMQKKIANVKDANAHSKVKQILPMLVSTSLIFLLLALPLQIVTIVFPTNPNDATTASAGTAKILWSFGLLTSYMNNGVNFYIYVASGRIFREEMVDMFLCRSTEDKYKGNSRASTVSRMTLSSTAER